MTVLCWVSSRSLLLPSKPIAGRLEQIERIERFVKMSDRSSGAALVEAVAVLSKTTAAAAGDSERSFAVENCSRCTVVVEERPGSSVVVMVEDSRYTEAVTSCRRTP